MCHAWEMRWLPARSVAPAAIPLHAVVSVSITIAPASECLYDWRLGGRWRRHPAHQLGFGGGCSSGRGRRGRVIAHGLL